MCNKANLENCGLLEFVPNCQKVRKMCSQAFDNYDNALKFLTQEMCDKVVNT